MQAGGVLGESSTSSSLCPFLGRWLHSIPGAVLKPSECSISLICLHFRFFKRWRCSVLHTPPGDFPDCVTLSPFEAPGGSVRPETACAETHLLYELPGMI